MSPTEAIPLLVVVLLMISIGGGDVQRMGVTFQGEQRIDSLDDVHVIAGGTSTVPAAAAVSGDVYAIGGTTRLQGTIEGDVTVLAGNLSIAETATVTGTVQTISGESSIAEGASIGRLSTFEAPVPSSSPVRRVGGFFLQFLVLGAVGWVVIRRRPFLLENIGAAVTDHTLVSGVVGALAAATLLVLFVYMAFTLLLLPLAILGLLGEFLVVLYGQVVFGYLVGTRLPIDRSTVATVAGIGLFLIALEVFGMVPYAGAIVQLGLVVVGFGAVLNTFFGLQRFEPVSIPGGEDR
jgi:cytoskeletal protein CcmA (bactofilin family)